MFYAYKDSEDNDGLDVLREVCNQPGVHSYPFVEIPLNTHLFHLDIAPSDDESWWQRFIFDRVENIFEFVEAENIRDFRIHVQTRREMVQDYQLKRIVEIALGQTISGECVYIFLCADRSTEIGSLNELTRDDITHTSTLWVEPDIRM